MQQPFHRHSRNFLQQKTKQLNANIPYNIVGVYWYSDHGNSLSPAYGIAPQYTDLTNEFPELSWNKFIMERVHKTPEPRAFVNRSLQPDNMNKQQNMQINHPYGKRSA